MKTTQEILKWYLDAGVDECIGLNPVNRLMEPQTQSFLRQPIPALSAVAPHEDEQAISSNLLKDALETAVKASSLDELKSLLESFNGCALKKTAKSTVFGEGNPHADVMFIGEAPGADEDRLGRPFVGRSGLLLDLMISAIGLSREKNAYISNIIPWRPPGNRAPSHQEIALCLPFIQRHIEFVAPKIIVLLGGTAFMAILKKEETISKSRGNWYEYQTPTLSAPIACIPIFHPAFLLRSPAQKKLAWRDLLSIQNKLAEIN